MATFAIPRAGRPDQHPRERSLSGRRRRRNRRRRFLHGVIVCQYRFPALLIPDRVLLFFGIAHPDGLGTGHPQRIPLVSPSHPPTPYTPDDILIIVWSSHLITLHPPWDCRCSNVSFGLFHCGVVFVILFGLVSVLFLFLEFGLCMGGFRHGII